MKKVCFHGEIAALGLPQMILCHLSNVYRQVSNIRRTLVGNWIVDNSDVVGASPVGAASTTSSFSTKQLASIYCAKATAAEMRNIKVLWFGASYIRDFTVDIAIYKAYFDVSYSITARVYTHVSISAIYSTIMASNASYEWTMLRMITNK